MTLQPTNTLRCASHTAKGIWSWGRCSESLAGSPSRESENILETAVFGRSACSLHQPAYSCFIPPIIPRCFYSVPPPREQLLLVSSALIGLYMVVQRVTTSSTLQNCCGWLLHRSASCYMLSPFMQTCLWDSGAVCLFILYSFHLTCPVTQQQTAGNCLNSRRLKLSVAFFLNKRK